VRDASADHAQLKRWWGAGSKYGIGIACGSASGVFALDVDPRNGGDDTLGAIEAKHGALPPTVRAVSGAGGQHILFKHPAGSTLRGRLGDGIDLKADGGYIVAEPSIHPETGKKYLWDTGYHPDEIPVADAPPWLIDALRRDPCEAGPLVTIEGADAADSVLGEAFRLSKRLGTLLPGGKRAAACPWSTEHTDGRGAGQDSSSVLLPPTSVKKWGAFHCSHAHCTGRTFHDVLAALPAEAVAAAHVKYGLTPPETDEEPSGPLPWDDADGCRALGPLHPKTFERVSGGWQGGLVWQKKSDGERVRYLPVACATTAIAILRNDKRWKEAIAYDEMAKCVTVVRAPPWKATEPGASADSWDRDSDPTRLVDWLQRAYGLTFYAEPLEKCVYVVAQDRSFHPVQAWLNRLPPHDGKERVEPFFVRYFGAEDSPYVRAVGRVLLVSLVARAMRPGCKADDVVVIEGEQGKRKSSAVKTLAGRKWFAENTHDIATKDAQLALHGKWLIEMPELAGMTKSEVEKIKAFFSRASDWLRPPFGKGFSDYDRSSICVATTNDKKYLKDQTGNRRYRPILAGGVGKAGKIDVLGIERDREQIFAEAFALFNAGVAWWFTDAEEALAKEQTEARETSDPWEETIRVWVHGRRTKSKKEIEPPPMRGVEGFSVPQLFEHALGFPDVHRQNPQDTIRIGKILDRLGFKETRPRDRDAERDAKARGERYMRPRIYRWEAPPSPPARNAERSVKKKPKTS
jgi:predicted P-loop ATPase